MAIFHRATVTPTKAELIAGWAPTQPWGPPAGKPGHVPIRGGTPSFCERLHAEVVHRA